MPFAFDFQKLLRKQVKDSGEIRMKRVALSIICLFLALTALGFGIFSKGGENTATTLLSVESQEQTTASTGEVSQTCLGDLTILMYHNTLAKGKKQSVYCINQDSLRKDFEYLKNNGYNVISCQSLIKYVDNGTALPDKAVILTFDDGYLNNMTYALPLLEEFGYSGLFSVVGDYTLFDKNGKGGGDFIYFGWNDIAQVSKNANVEIGLHSYSMHNTRPRLGVSQLNSESDEAYKQAFSSDTQKLVDKLGELGVTSNIYAYPYGKYTKISESVLKDKGIVMTLTCNEGINHIYGRRSLYLLKRINRDATKSSLGEVLSKYGA
ncbi:MAG: polysaccharide deacetylase family protein [Clostridia bacterium]|nr:polysaccharide deacetylase family protein [Clostridia bacterium]